MVEPDVQRVIRLKKKVVEEPMVQQVEPAPRQEPVEPAQILRNVSAVNINPIPIVSGVADEPGQVLKKRIVRIAKPKEETVAQVQEEEPKKITIRKIARPKEEVVEPAPALAQEQVEESAPAQVQEVPKPITIKKIARPKEDNEEQEIPESKPKFAVKKLTKSSETPETKSTSQEEEEDNSGYL
jgi:hypothetical protein